MVIIILLCISITIFWCFYKYQNGFVPKLEILFFNIQMERWWDLLFIPFFIVILKKLFGYEENKTDSPSEFCFALGDGFFVILGGMLFTLMGGVNALIISSIVFAGFYIIGFIMKFLDYLTDLTDV